MDNPELIEKCEQDLADIINKAHKDGLPFEQMIFPLTEVLENTKLKVQVEKEHLCR